MITQHTCQLICNKINLGWWVSALFLPVNSHQSHCPAHLAGWHWYCQNVPVLNMHRLEKAHASYYTFSAFGNFWGRFSWLLLRRHYSQTNTLNIHTTKSHSATNSHKKIVKPATFVLETYLQNVYIWRMHLENLTVHNIAILFHFKIGVVWSCVIWAGLSVSIQILKSLVFTIISLRQSNLQGVII
jgi:hypothetical protein